MSEASRREIPADLGVRVCFWCGEELYDASEESGWTGTGPDWASATFFRGEFIGGDFGCDSHPISDDEGCGPHETLAMVRDIVRAYHGDQT